MSGATPEPPEPARDPDAVSRLKLTQALQRAQYAIAWERGWPHLARFLTVVGLFLVASWTGLWLVLPFVARAVGLVLFVALALGALLPLIRFRWPSREQALSRLDRGSGIRHRPATALTDTLVSQDPVAQALWQAQRERTLASIKRIRAGLPSPAMVKCRSLVPLGACSVGTASVTPPPPTTSRLPPLERTISVEPAGTGKGPAPGNAASLFAAERMIGGLPV